MLAVAFGVICLYGLLSGFGTNLGLAFVNFQLPFINRIREAGRHLALFVIGTAFLSGLGYSVLARSFQRYKTSHQVRLLILPGISLLVFAGVILWEVCQIQIYSAAGAILDCGIGPDSVCYSPLL